MAIGNLCTTDVAIVDRATTVKDAAQLMRKLHVGDLVIVRSTNGKKMPVGIVTDRDIVLSVVATGLDSEVFTVGDLVTKGLVSCREDIDVIECIRMMRKHGIRRMPVTNGDGALVGIITVDDLVELLAEELGELAKLMTRERAREVCERV